MLALPNWACLRWVAFRPFCAVAQLGSLSRGGLSRDGLSHFYCGNYKSDSANASEPLAPAQAMAKPFAVSEIYSRDGLSHF